MINDSKEFALFIDGLRIDRKMSREDLCDEIISLSQYKRYLRGNTSIPNDIVIYIADKLKFSISDLHLMYRNRSDNQYFKINDIYHLISQNKFTEAYSIANKMKKEVIVSDSNQLFFDFCLLNIQYHLSLISDIQVLDLYSVLISYPDCINKSSYSWVEINVLIQIAQISAKIENYAPSDHIYTLLRSNSFANNYTGVITMVPGIYATIAKILGRQNKNEQVIEICKIAIQYCITHEISASLSHLYLFTSFAYHSLDKIELAKENSKKAFMQLYLEEKPEKFELFKIIFEEKFEMKLEELIPLKM